MKLQEEVEKDLKKLTDKKYQEFHEKICPSTNPILGVRVPILRKYAKKFYNKYPNADYKELKGQYYEEILLQGMLIALDCKNDYKRNIEQIDGFIKRIGNWAECDIFVGELKCIKKDLDKYWNYIKKCTTKKKEFEKRFAYVVMLDYYLTDKYFDEVLEILLNENSKEYYVYMSVAWALSICLIKDYNKTLNSMQRSNLNNITYNKALQKACESLRITKEQKDELRKLKRKK